MYITKNICLSKEYEQNHFHTQYRNGELQKAIFFLSLDNITRTEYRCVTYKNVFIPIVIVD